MRGRQWAGGSACPTVLMQSRLWISMALALVGQALSPAQTAHFHHVHLNTTDPAKAIAFYTSKFDCEKASFGGKDAVKAQDVWLLFTKVSEAPPWELVSPIWHIGWGAEDMKSVYQKQLDMGTKFFTPITDISKLANTPGFYYAYVDGPDHALIELNTAAHHHFGHLHLFSDDPIAAGEWYIKYFNARNRSNRPVSREPRYYEGVQVGPAMSLMSDQVNIIIFPSALAKQSYPEQWKGRSGLVSSQGRSIDHIGFSVDNVAQTIERMRKDGIKVTDDAFVEGPDKIRIEIVQAK
jgi:catechol 2,3-dioxygenase-like lactoylglutathione lyase family enzyme